jgi:hypothetical protein
VVARVAICSEKGCPWPRVPGDGFCRMHLTQREEPGIFERPEGSMLA